MRQATARRSSDEVLSRRGRSETGRVLGHPWLDSQTDFTILSIDERRIEMSVQFLQESVDIGRILIRRRAHRSERGAKRHKMTDQRYLEWKRSYFLNGFG